MCGIVGAFNPKSNNTTKKEISFMLNMIKYRGPDDSCIYIDEHIGIGHVRLSIQDLSPLAAQPMLSHNKNFVFAYNGEIYNIKDIQERLRIEGIELKSSGDTEALLEHLAYFGVKKTLAIIEGMFAFIFWDKKNNRVIAARDRHGIKPLYYRIYSDGTVKFSSEQKVLAFPEFEPDMNTINATLMGLGATWGSPTIFRQVNHVCAGEWMIFGSKGLIESESFFHINDFVDDELHKKLDSMSTNEIVDYVHSELNYNTKSKLLSDAPVAAFVSGGVDSSLIASLAKEAYPKLKLYHCNVNSESETKAATDLAKNLKLDLYTTSVSDSDILDNTAITTYHYEAPIHYHNGSCVPFYLLSKAAGKDGMKVILTGEGSDEYFLGYPNLAVRPYIQSLENIARRFQKIFHMIPRMEDFLWKKTELSPSEQLRNLMFRYELHDRREEARNKLQFIKQKREIDYMVACIDMVIGNVRTLLQRNDRLGMAGGLESRFPFLGERIAKVAVNLPSKYKIRKILHSSDWRHAFISDKWIVREIASNYMPRSLAFRKKFGFQSSVYRRLHVPTDFYRNGFIQEFYKLNDKAIDRMLETAPQFWREGIFALEIWGQVFPMRNSIDSIQDKINRTTKVIS